MTKRATRKQIATCVFLIPKCDNGMEITHLKESAREGDFLFTSYFSPFMFIATDVFAKRTQPDPRFAPDSDSSESACIMWTQLLLPLS
ncbi:hypothetical protein T265_05610 [Opisthorchis viverrini]|uniref:Uncharacterized protein n=1 Tax=Opisthorchis viverrini TaxID=6198 RepID=A0A075AF20_OPIVI|nr:hypothetical protein T265_05610 [Opisthorchis viverrini]KER27284.1 hypothetical protein T265_05610 [Opisthorchis viverrini]